MCTIIKIKRKITEDPVECLILECKKKKLSIDSDESTTVKSNEGSLIKQILKYAGSANNEQEIPAKIKELSSKLNEEQPPKVKAKRSRIPNGKPKESQKEPQKPLNYVLVNKKRGLDDQEEPENESETSDKKLKVNIIDAVPSTELEKESSKKEEDVYCNGVKLIREKVSEKKNCEYVYDIYYTKNADIHLDMLYPNNYEIKSFSNYQDVDLVDDTNPEEPEEFYEDDEDSNDEANWRNDYPDEEDDIDDENDDYDYGNRNRYNDQDEYDDYDDYANGYDDDEDFNNHDSKLAHYMKKSLTLDRSYHEDSDENEDDYDEYDKEVITKSYSSYKKRILKEMQQDYDQLD